MIIRPVASLKISCNDLDTSLSDFEEPLMSKVGSWSINLSDYVLKNEFNNRLTKVEKLLETFVRESEYKEQLNKIEKALSGVAWADLGEGE